MLEMSFSTVKEVSMDFFTRFTSNPDRADFVPEGKTKTQQQFLEQSDVNWIINHYQERPVDALQDAISGPRMPLWGDFSTVPDIQQAHRVFSQAEAAFGALPSDLRLRFNNNPLELLAFVSDAGNREEAIKLRLIEKNAVAPAVVPKADTTASVNEQTIKQA